MGLRKKSQTSIEFVFSIGIIFFIFLVVLGFMINRSKELTDSEDKINKQNTCLLVSSLLTSAFVNGNGIVINASIDYGANISLIDINTNYKELGVGGGYCLLSVHTIPNAQLNKGVIRLENRNNYVDIKNV